VGKFLIIGATGTLGRAMIKELLKKEEVSLIRCLSRDELKLSELERDFSDKRIETIVGDIRDKASIFTHFQDIDTVFHFAALKLIPEMEKFPLECIKTNLYGTINAAESALAHGVRNFMFSSTDKACLPINTYGASKFLAEQILFNFNRQNRTNFSIYRWGNIIGSRGSFVHTILENFKKNLPMKITHSNMTRYWIRIEDAVQFVLETYTDRSNDVRVPKMKSATVEDLVRSMSRVTGIDWYKTEYVGMRPGEKIHENLVFNPQWNHASSSEDEFYSPTELDSLVRKAIGL
jgi:UDP-N-acetylglucosamine 4,6-dehydratase